MVSPAGLWTKFLNNGDNTCSQYDALYNHFTISLASGNLRPDDFHRHVAGVLQVLESMAEAYASAENKVSWSGNKSAEVAISGLRCEVLDECSSLSQIEDLDVSQYSPNSEALKYCSFLTKDSPSGFKTGVEYAAFILAATTPFMCLCAYLAKELIQVANPSTKFLHWIERYASESFQASCIETERVLNVVCKEAKLLLAPKEFTKSGVIERRYMDGIRLAVEFFSRQVTSVEECLIVPLTKEHNPARELILIVCSLDSTCCYLGTEAYNKEFTQCIQSIVPIVKVGFVHENVLHALSQIADFEIKTRGLRDPGELNNFSGGFSSLLQKINNSKNSCNASIHVLSSLCNYELQSTVLSGCLKESSLHFNLESNSVKFDLFMTISREANEKKLLRIYVGNSIDDLGCLLEAQIGIVINPCSYMLSMCTKFGVSFVSLLEVTVEKQKQMREGIHSLWKSKTGTLYTVKSWDEITAFLFGAFEIDHMPKTDGARGPYECAPKENLFAGLPKPKTVSQSADSSWVENMKSEKPKTDGATDNPKKPPKTLPDGVDDFENFGGPSEFTYKQKLPLARILPKPKNVKLSVDSGKVENREPEKQQDEKPKTDDLSANPKKLPLALILPKPKNVKLSSGSSNVENVAPEKQQADNVAPQKQQDEQQDGKQQVEKEEDEQHDEE